jgi:hypothetical protein
MADTATLQDLEHELRTLAALPAAPVMTTCYLDVDGRRRPRMSDCMSAFAALCGDANRQATGEHASLLPAVQEDLQSIRVWLENGLDRAHVRGLLFVSCSLDGVFRVLQLPLPVSDEMTVAPRPHLTQLASLLENAQTYGVALVDHQRLRMLEYQLGEVREFPALVEAGEPHHVEQHAWTVIGSSSAAGSDATHWQPAGSHVDRHEMQLEQRHIERCASALALHLAEYPVDQLLIGGPAPERAQLERCLRDHHRITASAQLSVRVTAPLSELRDAIVGTVRDIEIRDPSGA